jgi:hypothetical protein
VKREREGDVVRNVDENAISLPLNEDTANIPAGRNRPIIKGGRLSWCPCEKYIAILNLSLAA